MRTIYKFIPYEKFTWQTSLSEEKIIGRLEANVNQKEVNEGLLNSAWTKNTTGKTFQGEISKEQFKIVGYTKDVDELIPVAIGKIEKTGIDHRIDVTIQFGVIPYLVLSAVIGITFIVSLFYIPSLFSEDPTYAPFAIWTIAYAFCMIAFKMRSREYRRFLKEMLAATDAVEYN